jgi:DNA recombination protein RmuC
MSGHLDKLGRSLGSAVGAYNDAIGSLERRVLSSARQFGELGVVAPNEPLDGPAPLLDAVPRPLTAGELAESKVVSLHDPLPRRSGTGESG